MRGCAIALVGLAFIIGSASALSMVLPEKIYSEDELIAVARENASPPTDMAEVPASAYEEGSGDDIIVPVVAFRAFAVPEEPEEVTIVATAFRCKSEDGNGDDDGLTVNCQEGGLTEVPTDLNIMVTILDFGRNNFTELTAATFPERLENLKDLSFEKNAIASIDKLVFSRTPRLEKLNLADNALTAVEADAFLELPALAELLLSGNPLLLAEGAPLLHAPALRILALARCRLARLPESTFDGTTSLEEIDLGYNAFDSAKSVPPSAFAALTNLSSLTLPREGAEGSGGLAEICRSHGLLATVCLDSCSGGPPPVICADLYNATAANAANAANAVNTVNAANAANAETDDLMKPKEDLPASTQSPVLKKVKSKEQLVAAESVPESSRSGVSGAGVNKTIIAIIICSMLAAVAGVLLKKNWGKVRAWAGSAPAPAAAAAPAPAQPASPEEVPLQSKAPAPN